MYNLKITENQAHTISRATELYARLSAGQFHEIIRLFPEADFDSREKAESLVPALKKLLTGNDEGTADFRPEHIKVAFDIHKVIRHELHNQDSCWGCTHCDDVVTDSTEPLAVISEVE